MRILWLVLAIGCGSPCEDPGACTGTVVVNLGGDTPSFSMEGTGAVVPDTLTVALRTSCTDGRVVWNVEQIPDLGGPIVYGELPDGAIEEPEPIALEEGEDYDVVFSKALGASRSVVVEGWSALFTWGDPNSVRFEDADCP